MTDEDPATRLERLRGYLAADPGNLPLTLDCAEAALAADQPAQARALLAPLHEAGERDDRLDNLAGLAAMRDGDQAAAQQCFTRLLERHPQDPGAQFNLAWSLALSGHDREARVVLDDVAAGAALPQVALLDLQLHHRGGELDDAAAKLDAYLTRFPDYAPLQATASVLAMDLERPELARRCAERAGSHPDALATLGALELGEDRAEEARALFERALATRPVHPRASVGLGLVELADGNPQAALPHLDRGAEQFDTHLGSWLAAGWAHFAAGDAAAARDRFEIALSRDDTFGEAYGSLAAIAALSGDTQTARARLEVARRLDRDAFSVALATMVLTAAEGDQATARRIFERALQQPLAEGGPTLAAALARVAL